MATEPSYAPARRASTGAADDTGPSGGAAAPAAAAPAPAPAAAAPSERAAGRATRPAAVAFLACLALGHLPLLVRYADNLWARPHYRFAFVVVPLGAWLVRERLRDAAHRGWDGRPPRPGGRAASALFFAGALLVTLAASYLWSRWLGVIAAVLTLAAAAYAAGGGRLLRLLAPAFVLLMASIPPPLGLDGRLLLLMRGWAIRGASAALDALGVLHDARGLLIDLPGRQLLVEEACSGINSLMAVLGAAVLAGVWRRASARRVAAWLVAGAGLVLWLNVVRIAAAAACYARWRVDLLSGAAHDYASLVIWLLCVGLLASADRGLDYFRGRAEPPPAPPGAGRISAARGDARAPEPRRAWRWALAAAYLCCGLLQVRQGYAAGYWQSRWTKDHALRDDARFALPDRLAGWTRLAGSGPVQLRLQTVGAKSERWFYRDGRLVVGLALDYPFRGYHDLTRCYDGGGWTLGPDAGDVTAGAPYCAYPMTAPPSHGRLYYAVFDEGGRYLSPAEYDDYGGVWGRVKGIRADRTFPTYQVQAFAQSYAPFTPDDEQRVRALFLEARALLRQQVLDQLERR